MPAQDQDLLVIGRRFCGPPASGNGGYVCGRLAAYIDGCAKVRLMIPPPLDHPLRVVKSGDGVELRSDGGLVAQAWPITFELKTPGCPSWPEALAMAGRYRGLERHAFATCFVCGPNRGPGDGLRIFPGLSPAGNLVASPWVPDSSLGDEHGEVHPWFIWAALDCPSGWAFLHAGHGAAVLGELSVRIDASIAVGQELIVVGWELSHTGRKHHTASALFSAAGDVLGRGMATWFEVTPEKLAG